MFKRLNGRTAERAARLDSTNFPSYMVLGEKYRVIEGPVNVPAAWDWDNRIYRYLVGTLYAPERTFYIETMYVLPQEFWQEKS